MAAPQQTQASGGYQQQTLLIHSFTQTLALDTHSMHRQEWGRDGVTVDFSCQLT